MCDRNDTKHIIVNELYNKKKKGFYFYIQSPYENNYVTVKYFLSDKEIHKRNLSITDLINYIEECCCRYGIQDGIAMVDSYYKLD